MGDFNELKEGMTLDGVYTLEHWMRNDETGGFFAVLNESGERLLAKLIPEQDGDSEEQFATWDRSRQLRHPHLLDVRNVGVAELAGERYIFAVFEYPEDVLASALEQGPLSETETLDVLEAALSALRYLHGQGMVHGRVDAWHIVAVGETVKLASDALRESGDLEGHPEDVRQLGELVRTLRDPEPLSELLATVVQNATAEDPRERWTLAEIASVLAPPPASVAVSVEPPAPLPEPQPVIAPEPQAVPVPLPHPPAAIPKWIYAGVAVLLLFIAFFNLRRRPEPTPATTTIPAAVMTQAPPTPPVTASVPPAQAMWRVIAFTYRSRDIATKKAEQINNRWPDLRAEVFAPKAPGGYYLVALGDGMKRDEATRLQRKARSLGLPRDTYVQNYSE